MKALPFHHQGELIGHMIECPACGFGHLFSNKAGEKIHPKGCSWDFNGDTEKPTFTPSMLSTTPDGHGGKKICHSFVTDGKIKFLGDCTHKLAGQTVDLPEIE